MIKKKFKKEIVIHSFESFPYFDKSQNSDFSKGVWGWFAGTLNNSHAGFALEDTDPISILGVGGVFQLNMRDHLILCLQTDLLVSAPWTIQEVLQRDARKRPG